MSWFPYEHFYIETDLSHAAAYTNLADAIANSNQFKGGGDPHRFTISPVLTYRNSFAPEIAGEFIDERKTTLDIRIRINPAITAILFLMIAFLVMLKLCLLLRR